MNQTLTKLFPEKETYEEKIYEFLQCLSRNGHVHRRTASELGITHNTVKTILESVLQTDTYARWYEAVHKAVRGFASKDFAHTIFDEYRQESERLDELLAEPGIKHSIRNGLLKLKYQLMRDQLTAALFHVRLRKRENVDEDVDTAVYDLVLLEAKKGKPQVYG